MTPTSASQVASELAAGLARLQPLLDASTARVSSGNRLDQPSRDVVGQARAAELDASQGRWAAAETNLQNVTSHLQVATDQLDGINDIVNRLGELAVRGQDPVLGAEDRAALAVEFTALQEQLRQTIGGSWEEIGGEAGVERPLGSFNGRELFGADGGEVVAVGDAATDTLTLPVTNLRTGAVGALIRQDASGTFTLDGMGEDAVALVTAAGEALSAAQATVAATWSRVEAAGERAITARTNAEAAWAEISDTDLAEETTRQARLQLLSESHTAMLAQAREATAKLLPLLER